MAQPDASDSDPKRTPPPEPRLPLEVLILVAGLGVSFITAGATLGALSGPFRVLGIFLLVIGLAIVTAAVWPHARQLLLPYLRVHYRRLAGLTVCALAFTVITDDIPWRQDSDEPVQTATAVATLDVEQTEITMEAVEAPRQECDRGTGECSLIAANQPRGDPLVVNLVELPTDRSPDAVLAAATWLEGATDGRYVALACRSGKAGEYVLAVWPQAEVFQLLRWDEGALTPLAEGRRPGTILPGNSTNRLELRCIGPEIGAVINNTPVATVPDKRHRTGGWYVAAGISRVEDLPSGPVSARFTELGLVPVTPTPRATPQP